MSRMQTQTATNLRRWMRFPAQVKEVELYWNEDVLPAQVVDESFQGLGVRLAPEVPAPPPGETVLVAYAGATMKAQVRHVSAQEDGSTRVGLQWIPERSSPEPEDPQQQPLAVDLKQLWQYFLESVPTRVYELANLSALQQWEALRRWCQQTKTDAQTLELNDLILALEHLDDLLSESSQATDEAEFKALVQAAVEQVVQRFGQATRQQPAGSS